MDAIGLSNYAATNGIKSQAKTANPQGSGKTDSAGKTSQATSMKPSTPIVDTVQLRAPAKEEAPVQAVFDPTAVSGPYEQKHVGGKLATTSALDDYDGWAAMLKHCFGHTDNPGRTDMPVIPYYNSLNNSVDGYGPAGGYVPANALTNEERNLIANIYVYAHDHGMSEDGAAGLISSAMVDIARSGRYRDRLMEYDVGRLAEQAADTKENVHGISNRDMRVDYIRRYGFTTKNNAARDDAEALKRDEVALRTLSSPLLRDNLISEHAVNWSFVYGWSGENHRDLGTFEELEKLVHAYSRQSAAGTTGEGGAAGAAGAVGEGAPLQMSALAKRYAEWRKGEVAARHSLEAEAKEPPTKDLVEIRARNAMNADHYWVSWDNGPYREIREVAEERLQYYQKRVAEHPEYREHAELEFWQRVVEIKHEEEAGEKANPLATLEKYSERISGLMDSLDDGQKAVLSKLYKLAEKKGDETALRKVDALANAFASNNTLSILFTPGKDKDGNPTTNLLDMMLVDPKNKEKPQVKAAILTKKYVDALSALQERLFGSLPTLDLSKTKVRISGAEAVPDAKAPEDAKEIQDALGSTQNSPSASATAQNPAGESRHQPPLASLQRNLINSQIRVAPPQA